MNRIIVTGMGAISAIGNSVAENRLSLIQGKCGMSRIEMFPTRFSDTLPAGEIKISNSDLKKLLDAHETGVTRTSLLALHALQEAISDCGWTLQQLTAEDTALIMATTIGGMSQTDEMHNDGQEDTHASEYISSYDYASVSLYLQNKLGIKGPVNSINTACSSSANAIMYACRLLRAGIIRRAIVGGADSLAKFTINGFNALRILSPDKCAPFDNNRKGLNLGEGAAFITLELEIDTAGRKNYASVSGYSNTNDAYHASSLSDNGRGPYEAMKSALDMAGLDHSKVDFINAHGTGTENNDRVESIAMQRLFGNVPPFNSSKANTGHTLGAAGALEAVYSILNLYEQELYPCLHFENAIIETGLIPMREYKKIALNHILSNSFGFGGNCSSLLFSKF